MTGYAADYFDLICERFNRMAITTDSGMEVSEDEGFEIWAERARDIQQNTKGLIFFCGNGASASMGGAYVPWLVSECGHKYRY